MFITNNHDSFHLWWHENFVSHQNVSKDYGQDCLKFFFFAFYFLISSFNCLKHSSFLTEFYFILLENVIHQTSKAFNIKFGPQWKDRRSSSEVKQIFVLFCQLLALILGSNCIKPLRVSKIVKEIRFEGAWW